MPRTVERVRYRDRQSSVRMEKKEEENVARKLPDRPMEIYIFYQRELKLHRVIKSTRKLAAGKSSAGGEFATN